MNPDVLLSDLPTFQTMGVEPAREARDIQYELYTGQQEKVQEMFVKTGRARMYKSIWACRLYEIQPSVIHDAFCPLVTPTKVHKDCAKWIKPDDFWNRRNIKQSDLCSDFPEVTKRFPLRTYWKRHSSEEDNWWMT